MVKKPPISTPPRDFRTRLDAISAATGFDLVKIAVNLALHKDPGTRLAALRLLADYSYPKLKSVEHTGDTAGRSGFVLKIVRSGAALPAPTSTSGDTSGVDSAGFELLE